MSRMMHLFRKYQYLLLVFFGVLLMIVFVVGDALQSFMNNRGSGGGGREVDPVVVTWRKGKITSSDLYTMRVKHAILMEFLNEIVQETMRREGSPKGFGIVPARDDQDLVRKIMLAAKAESMGLVVDNDAAQAFLRQLSDNLLDGPDFQASYDKVVRGRITQQHLMDQLKRELTADQLMIMSRTGLFATPPHEAWELHKRLHRRVQPELALLKVDDFKAKVTGQPSEAQITSIYEQGKDEFPYPASPEPGFKRRRKVNFEFVKADLSKYTEEEAKKISPTITDTEIEEYYNKNKERYRVLDLPPTPGGTEQTPAEPTTPAPANESTTPPTTPESKPAEGTESKPAEEKPAAEEKSTTEEKPATEEKATSNDKPQEKTEDQSDEKPATEQPTPEAQGATSGSTKLTLVAFQQPETTSADAAAPAEAAQPATSTEAPAAPEKTDNAAPEKTDSAPAGEADPAAKSPPAAEAPANNPEQPATTEAAPATTETPPAAPAGTPTEKKPEPKYKPLDDKLREEIRNEIARDRALRVAQERADKGLDAVRTLIEQHGRKLRNMEIAEGTSPSVAPPDHEQLALEQGLAAGETGLVDELGVQEFELGQTTEFSMGGPNGFQQIPFSQFGFDPALQPYRPQRIRDFVAQLEFIYWIVDSQEEHVPELKDIRDEVIDKWKQQEAFLMAKAEADKLSKELPGDKPLAESLKDHPEFAVSQPPPFSWMSTGFTPFGSSNAPALSNVAGVDSVNDEFMKSVFSLSPNEVGVAVNQPQTAVYIVRVVSESPSEEVLREQFLSGGVTNEIQHMALVQTNDLWLGWYADLERELQVEWKN